MYTLRKYQEEAKDAILSSWEEGNRKTLLVLPTGCGKTVVFSSVIDEQVKKGHKVLILAHRGELLEQASDKLKSFGIITALEKASSTALNDIAPVTVASVQTLSRDNRLYSFPKDYYQDIIVDEAHHCLVDSYQKILNYFSEANVLGVTATPNRGDMRDLADFFDNKAYEYNLANAINDEFLTPIKAQMIPLQLDISNVGISGGDFIAGEIGNSLEPYLEKIGDEMLNYCKGRKTVVFTPLVRTSQLLCKILNKKGLKATEINANSTEREQILKDFEEGQFEVILNALLLTEGWDCPSVDCVIVLRPTKIRSLFQQCVGRGLRLSPGKKDCLLLDFLWLSEKHDLCHPSSLIAEDEEIAKRMDEVIENNENGLNLLELAKQVKGDMLNEKEEALKQELLANRSKSRKVINPIEFAVSIASERLLNYQPVFMWEKEGITEKQKEFLENSGIIGITQKGVASAFIDTLIKRRQSHLSTPKQIRCLESFGFEKVGLWSFAEASKMIDALANNKWKIPQNINPKEYKR